jgi:hypothetical protein
LLPGSHEVSSSPPSRCFCLGIDLKAMELSNGLKPLKLWAKINPSSLKLLISGCSDET